MEADLQALPVGVFFFALGHDVDHPAGLVAACAAHALDVADGRRVRVKAHNQIYLQEMSLVYSFSHLATHLATHLARWTEDKDSPKTGCAIWS